MKQVKTEYDRLRQAIQKNERRIAAGKPNEPGRETWEERRNRLTLALLRLGR